MKFCPTCETRYDEEILRFCMKDGTPLVDEEEPNFVTMPSESLEGHFTDDPDEVTVVRRNRDIPPAPPSDEDEGYSERFDSGQRIVVPTSEELPHQQPHIRVAPPYQRPSRANTFKVVVLTIIGTLAVLGVFGAGIWLLQRNNSSDRNANANLANANIDLNTNLGIGTDFNFNANANFNTNINANANIRTPTPTPKPSPSPTPTSSPSPTPDDDDNTNTNVDTRPRITPTPFPTPTPFSNRSVNGGVLNSRAISLATPIYPPAARQMGASGRVEVMVIVDETGRVVSARAISGHPLLRPAAEAAARQSRIIPARLDNQNVRSTGTLLYNFRNN